MKSMRLPAALGASSSAGGRSVRPTPPPREAADEKVPASRLQTVTSSSLVMTQKPGPSGSAWKWTGSFSRSQVNHSWGMPSVKRSKSSRSICMALLPCELGGALLDEGQRADLGVVAREARHADGRVDGHGLGLGPALGGPQRL